MTIVLAAICNHGNELYYAGNALKNDKKFILSAVKLH